MKKISLWTFLFGHFYGGIGLFFFFVQTPFAYGYELYQDKNQTLFIGEPAYISYGIHEGVKILSQHGPGLDISTSIFLKNNGEIRSLEDHGIHGKEGSLYLTLDNRHLISGEKIGIFGENRVNLSIKNGNFVSKNSDFDKAEIMGKKSAIYAQNLQLDNRGYIRNTSSLPHEATIVVASNLGQDLYDTKKKNIIRNFGVISNDGGGPSILFSEGYNVLELYTGSKIHGRIIGEGKNPASRHELVLKGHGVLATEVSGFDNLDVWADKEGWKITQAPIRHTITVFSGVLSVSHRLGAPTSTTVIMPGSCLGSLEGKTALLSGNVFNKGGVITGYPDDEKARSSHWTIEGKYEGLQNSVFKVKILSNDDEGGSHDHLSVKETSDFSQTRLHVMLRPAKNAELFKSENNYTVVDGPQANFTFQDITSPSYAFFKKPLFNDQGQLTLSFKNKDNPFLIEGLKPNAQHLAHYLSERYNTLMFERDTYKAGEASAQMTDKLNGLLALTQEESLPLFNAGNAEIYGQAASGVLENISAVASYFHDFHKKFSQQEKDSKGSVVPMVGAVFMQGSYTQASPYFDSVTKQMFGTTLGLDYSWKDNKNLSRVVLGLFQTKINMPETAQEASLQSYHILGQHYFNPKEHLSSSFLLSCTYFSGQANRQLSLNGKQYSLEGPFSGYAYTASAQVNFPFETKIAYLNTLTFDPFMRLSFLGLHQSPTHESTQSPAHMDISAQKRYQLETLLGVHLKKSFLDRGVPLKCDLSLGWLHTKPFQKNVVQHTLPFGGDDIKSFSSYAQRDQHTAYGSASLSYRLLSSLMLTGKCQGLLGKLQREYVLSLGASLYF